MESIAEWLVSVVHGMGYPGIFLAMGLGNLLVPIPVEFVMIPAGYLVHGKVMHFAPLICWGILGDIVGSLAAYYLALHLGRRVLLNFGKHFFFDYKKMEMLDRFFANHGEISVLTGRLVPGLRHFMAFPAGLSHMNVKKFTIYTGFGGGLWMSVLIGVGYLIGGNQRLIKRYMPIITGAVVVGMCIVIAIYIQRKRQQPKPEETNDLV